MDLHRHLLAVAAASAVLGFMGLLLLFVGLSACASPPPSNGWRAWAVVLGVATVVLAASWTVCELWSSLPS